MDREMDREVPVKIRDGPLENLWGGGGRSTKKNSCKGKLNEKNYCTPINPNIHAMA